MLTIATVFLFLFQEYNCYLVLPPGNGSSEVNVRPINYGKMPEHFDWRDKNMVSPVKDQMDCAACWAFSTIANLESHLKIYLGVEELLSEQFLIDCDEQKRGCADASIIQTFSDLVTQLGGVLREKDYYPYAQRRMQCRWDPPSTGKVVSKYGTPPYYNFWAKPQPELIPVVGFRRVLPDEDAMAQAVYSFGPLSAAINSASMATYKGGIDEPTKQSCNPKDLDHAVLIVGYNVYVSSNGDRLPYWIIKNSWGTNWGDAGFYYLVRGRNACGIASDVSFGYVS